MSDDGLVSVRSAHSARETIAHVEADLAAKGVTVFAKIDHAAGAAAAGLTLRPTTLIIFGGAQGRHAADASLSARRHRPSAESARVGGRGRHSLADLQRSSLGRSTAHARPSNRTDCPRHVGHAGRGHTQCNRSGPWLVRILGRLGGQRRGPYPTLGFSLILFMSLP